jgi:hypothetical protein
MPRCIPVDAEMYPFFDVGLEPFGDELAPYATPEEHEALVVDRLLDRCASSSRLKRLSEPAEVL